ncbi:MAG: hypothetical protein M3063_14850 [Actinomycetota bacterium]|nr:hypothetical protein [Actinomycetota bacterium]
MISSCSSNDKYVFQLPTPTFDPNIELHRTLVGPAERAELLVGTVELPATSFQALRRRVRGALNADGVAGDLDHPVGELLG